MELGRKYNNKGKITKWRGKIFIWFFIEVEKSYDVVTKNLIWQILKRNISRCYNNIIKNIYEGVATSLRTIRGEISEFPKAIGLHQVSTLSPYLFDLRRVILVYVFC